MENDMENYYEILKVKPTCTLDELRVNYKNMILQYHPDKVETIDETSDETPSITTTDNRGESNERFLSIMKAWNCLKDPIKRKQYDANLMLQKFEMLSNAYAHITLNDMIIKKEVNFDPEVHIDADIIDNTNQIESCYYCYVYNCRCGGQYILNYDDLTKQQQQQQQFKRYNSHKSLIDNENYNMTDKNNKKKTKTFCCSNTEEDIVCKNKNNNDDNDEENVVEQHTPINTDEEESENAELIIECSECSLVVIVNVGA